MRRRRGFRLNRLLKAVCLKPATSKPVASKPGGSKLRASEHGASKQRVLEVEIHRVGGALHQIALQEVDAAEPQRRRGLRILDVLPDHLQPQTMGAVA